MKTLREEIAEIITPLRNNPEKWGRVKALISSTWEPADLISFQICYRDDLIPGYDLEEFDEFLKQLREIAAA